MAEDGSRQRGGGWNLQVRSIPPRRPRTVIRVVSIAGQARNELVALVLYLVLQMTLNQRSPWFCINRVQALRNPDLGCEGRFLRQINSLASAAPFFTTPTRHPCAPTRTRTHPAGRFTPPTRVQEAETTRRSSRGLHGYLFVSGKFHPFLFHVLAPAGGLEKCSILQHQVGTRGSMIQENGY